MLCCASVAEAAIFVPIRIYKNQKRLEIFSVQLCSRGSKQKRERQKISWELEDWVKATPGLSDVGT